MHHRNSGAGMGLPKEGERPWAREPLTLTETGGLVPSVLNGGVGVWKPHYNFHHIIPPPEVSPYVYTRNPI